MKLPATVLSSVLGGMSRYTLPILFLIKANWKHIRGSTFTKTHSNF